MRAARPRTPDASASPAPVAVPRLPIALARRFYQIVMAVLAEMHHETRSGLRDLEFGVMVRVHDTPGLDQNSLAERLALDRTSVSAMVFRLEQLGLLDRSVNGNDRRARILRLTRKGKALHDRVRPLAERAQGRVLEVLPAAERRALVSSLARIIEANQQYVRPGAGRRRPVRRKPDTDV